MKVTLQMSKFNHRARKIHVNRLIDKLYHNLDIIYPNGWIIDCGSAGRANVSYEDGTKHRFVEGGKVIYGRMNCLVTKNKN
jgi:hypothetical protein